MCVAAAGVLGCRSTNRLPSVGSKAYEEYVSTFYVGLAGLQVGDDVRADAKLQQATELVPGEPAGWVDWGVLALRQRNFDAAAERLGRAQALEPHDDRIEYLLGLLEGGRGNAPARGRQARTDLSTVKSVKRMRRTHATHTPHTTRTAPA